MPLSSSQPTEENGVCRLVPIFAGGGTRLATHIGILKALEELKIEFEHLVGVSGGSIISSIFLLIRTFLTTMSREYISEDFWHKTIIINIGSVSPINFNITKEQKLELFRRGYETAKEIVPWKIIKK